MVDVRAIGLSINDPQRGQVALRTLAPLFTPPASLDGVGVGTCVPGSVLLSKKPTARAPRSIDEWVGQPKGQVSLVQFRSASDLRPAIHSPQNMAPYRFRGLGCVLLGGPQTSDEAMAARERWLAELPDFLRRSIRGQTEEEAFFFAVLATLHRAGRLERPEIPGNAVVDAVLQTREAAADDAPRFVGIGTGPELALTSHRMESVLVSIDGLSEAVADAVDPTLADSSPGRERLRRFRGILCMGGVGTSSTEWSPPERGVTLSPQPAHAQVVVSKNGVVRNR